MKILNLDQFAVVTRQVKLGGVSHNVREVCVQDFVNNLTAAEQLETAVAAAGENEEMSIGLIRKGIEDSIVAIRDSIPTLEEPQVRALGMTQMSALLQFIRGELDPVMPSEPAAVAQEGTEAKKD
jgi:hypothetical protein